MIKYTIPSVLIAITLVAGIFAFMPIEQATTVHTTIQQSTTHIVDSIQGATATDDEFRVTCPVTSDGCIINEAYIINQSGNGDTDINSIQLEIPTTTDFQLAAEGDNTVLADDAIQAVQGVSGLAIGASDVICFDMTGTITDADNTYSLKVIATVEGDLSDITIIRVPDAGC